MSAASTAEPVVAAPSTIVVGLGNPILGDDAAGWRVAEAVEASLATLATGADPTARAVVVERLAVGGLTLMEHLVGYRRAILVDALVTGEDAPGTVRRMRLDAVPGREAGHLDSAHDTTLATALDAGRALGATVPDTVEVVTIEAVRVLDLSEAMTEPVAAAVPIATALVLELLDR